MWLFTRYGFYSVACGNTALDDDDAAGPEPMIVRALSKAHLKSLQSRFKELSRYKVLEWPKRDYRFRIIVPKEIWIKVLAELGREQTWSNFKNEVAGRLSGDHKYNHALHEVWGVMNALQEGGVTPPEPEPEPKHERLPQNQELPALLWDGITKAETLGKENGQQRQELADYAKRYSWAKVFDILDKNPSLVNTVRPGARSLYSPLHQAAHGGAPLEVVEELIARGAWRSLKTAKGERAADIARKKGHAKVAKALKPVHHLDVPPGVLSRIQSYFHDLIRERAAKFVDKHALRLPELEVMLESPIRRFWCPVPGMYGGFAFWFAYEGQHAKLIVESWCRVCGGSGQRHEITAAGCTLVDEGFV